MLSHRSSANLRHTGITLITRSPIGSAHVQFSDETPSIIDFRLSNVLHSEADEGRHCGGGKCSEQNVSNLAIFYTE